MSEKVMNDILKKRIEEAAAESRRASAETLTTFGLQSSIDDVVELTEMELSYDEVAESAFEKGAEYVLSHQWISVEEALPDRKEYDWVLIQIQMDDGFMCVPKIGEIRNDGYWHCAEYDELYKIGESFEKEMGCKVIAWMPIPKFETKK